MAPGPVSAYPSRPECSEKQGPRISEGRLCSGLVTWRCLIHPNNLTMGILVGDDIGVGADFEAAAVDEAPFPHASCPFASDQFRVASSPYVIWMPCVGGLKWADRPVPGIAVLDVSGPSRQRPKRLGFMRAICRPCSHGRSLGAGALTCLIPLFQPTQIPCPLISISVF